MICEDPSRIEIFMYRGMYRILILSILERSKMRGYHILKNIARLTGMKPSLSTLHDILSEMEGNKLISSITEQTNEKYYVITSLGREKLREIRDKCKEKIMNITNFILGRRE
ncbi:MAG: PadR family transcriptional regulator [archaeon GB-1867-097]|nr:PadR family transcriptional regulator [Candidatus Verstraetearchaeota archaeon]MCS7373611.1 PadR family transcriptional regulator [Candidatus Culexmicrobium thermophilum]MCS7384288.1 PadR family transcriptional regulator [Candidatus Culexmicrobium thermophilum]RLE55325.1 MAG: hypothetical protein DRJ30_03995 [Candidatus Verstraetearchaeota archaeon]HDO20440.1 PadR family transcriptional regulator [Candidatus Bathyarchaeota archaeon]